jgi:hypothetical protein
MEGSVQREKLGIAASAILLGVAILVFPNQFLFAKTIPNSFWTEYFPLPFGAGWFITFIALFPVIWLNRSTAGAIKSSVLGVFLSICVATPVALFIIGGTLSPNNLLSQYLWVGIICAPPLMLQIILRWLLHLYSGKWLTKRS